MQVWPCTITEEAYFSSQLYWVLRFVTKLEVRMVWIHCYNIINNTCNENWNLPNSRLNPYGEIQNKDKQNTLFQLAFISSLMPACSYFWINITFDIFYHQYLLAHQNIILLCRQNSLTIYQCIFNPKTWKINLPA